MFSAKIKMNIKKGLLTGASSAALLGALLPGIIDTAEASAPDIESEASITVDYETGQILQGEAVDEPLAIASMTKMLAEYIVFEEIEVGNLAWDEEITISDYAYEISQDNLLSNVPLRAGDTYSLEELYEAMAIYSANGATIAIAEHIEGSEPNFVDRMSELVKSFGITDAQLYNATGLNNEDLNGNIYPGSSETDENTMSARSSAIIANKLLTDYPEVLEVASVPRKTFRPETVDAIDMVNWNWMLEGLIAERPHVDGLKTGTTVQAGATFTGTAEEDGRRLITVVLNSGDDKMTRFVETDKMLDFGFEKWEMENVTDQWKENFEYEPLAVTNGKEDIVDYEPSEALEMLIQLDDTVEEEVSYSITWDPDIIDEEDGTIAAPFEVGMEIGELVVEYTGNEYGYLGDEQTSSVPLVTTAPVEKAGIFSQAWNWVLGIFDSFASRF